MIICPFSSPLTLKTTRLKYFQEKYFFLPSIYPLRLLFFKTVLTISIPASLTLTTKSKLVVWADGLRMADSSSLLTCSSISRISQLSNSLVRTLHILQRIQRTNLVDPESRHISVAPLVNVLNLVQSWQWQQVILSLSWHNGLWK